MTTNQLQLINLTCERADKILFTRLNLSLNSGEMILIQGENGTGKSSLLRTIAGLLPISSGEILWNGTSIHKDYEVFKKNLIYIGHQNGLRPLLTLHENLSFYLGNTENNMLNALENLSLLPYQNTQLYKLSAGQQRKSALARLYLQTAKVWILDEPFTAIDSKGQKLLTQRMDKHLEQGGMILASSHYDIAVKSSQKKRLSLSRESI